MERKFGGRHIEIQIGGTFFIRPFFGGLKSFSVEKKFHIHRFGNS